MENQAIAIGRGGRCLISSVLVACFFACASLLFWTRQAQAASMYFGPSSGSYAVGQSFSVGVFVTSADQAMNAFSGTFSFPKDLVEVTGLSKSSITSLWIQEPSYSNDSGTVSFKGIVLDPGFTGSGGKIITVTFRARTAGTVPFRFSESAILANDGQGTSILTGTSDASFKIVSARPASGQIPAAPVDQTPPEAPVVTRLGPEDSTELRPGVTIQTEDALSGVSYYEMSIDGGASIKIPESDVANATPYYLPTQQPGAHTIRVVAYDLAGNASASTELSLLILSAPAVSQVGVWVLYRLWSLLVPGELAVMFLTGLLLLYLLWRRHQSRRTRQKPE